MIISLPFCDICGTTITGEYYSIRRENTESASLITTSRLAVCSKCATKIRKEIIQFNQNGSEKE